MGWAVVGDDRADIIVHGQEVVCGECVVVFSCLGGCKYKQHAGSNFSRKPTPVVVPAPRNNDGRSECFWCIDAETKEHIKTQKRGDGSYDVCPECEK